MTNSYISHKKKITQVSLKPQYYILEPDRPQHVHPAPSFYRSAIFFRHLHFILFPQGNVIRFFFEVA